MFAKIHHGLQCNNFDPFRALQSMGIFCYICCWPQDPGIEISCPTDLWLSCDTIYTQAPQICAAPERRHSRTPWSQVFNNKALALHTLTVFHTVLSSVLWEIYSGLSPLWHVTIIIIILMNICILVWSTGWSIAKHFVGNVLIHVVIYPIHNKFSKISLGASVLTVSLYSWWSWL